MTKDELYRKGWTITSAARAVGVTIPHLSKVLSGERRSRVLTRKLESLPRTTPSKYAPKYITTAMA